MSGRRSCILIVALVLALQSGVATGAQWTNRYPRLAGYSHHVYVEGYELPLVTRGPIDAVASPVDERIVFSSRGWLWMLEDEVATRLTMSRTFDSRPMWAPDGTRIAFVRDDTTDTAIAEIDLASHSVRTLVDTPALDLDPAYSRDGRALLYSSAVAGDLDIWHLTLSSGETERLTTESGIELRPLPRTKGFVYLAKGRGKPDEVRVREGGTDRIVWAGNIASQTRPAVSIDGKLLALSVPIPDGWRLELLDLAEPDTRIALTGVDRLPLTPSWGPGDASVLFSEAGRDKTMRLFRALRNGGEPAELVIERWDWGTLTGRLRVRTRLPGGHGYVPARLNVRSVDMRGQVPETGQIQFDGRNGMTFFYSPGEIDIDMVAGPATISATHGLATPPLRLGVQVEAGRTTVVDAVFEEPLWDSASAGWYAGDHHFHLNYGGPYRLRPEDLILPAQAEGMDVLTPLTANLHNRFEDQAWYGWGRARLPLIAFGQEIRSHFLGHVGLIGGHDMFWPWIWGPSYAVYRKDDRPNSEPLRHIRAEGGVGFYVHPVSSRDPFGVDGLGSLPLAIIPDALAGDLDALEIACLWSDEIGTSELWYRLLNLGIPIAPSAGTDVMNNFFRTMAIGTARVYVRTGKQPDLSTYLDGLRAGRSFVTTAPMLLLSVGSGAARPGDVTSPGLSTFTINLHSAVAVERVELLVNGEVVWSDIGLREAGSLHYGGDVRLPEGGWIAARAIGLAKSKTPDDWPMMNPEPFAHTAPVWIAKRGSTEPTARAAAASDLKRALEVAWQAIEQAYAEDEIPRLRRHFKQAQDQLIDLSQPNDDPSRN